MRYIVYSSILYFFILRQWNFQRGSAYLLKKVHPDSSSRTLLSAYARASSQSPSKMMASVPVRSPTRDSRSTENEDGSGEGGEGCPRARERVGGWVLARRECVGAVRRSGDCLHPLSLSHSCPSSLTPSCSICPSPSLSSSLSTPSPILVLSLIFSPSLVFSLVQRDYSREHPGGQSVRRQPPRRRDAPLSLSSLPRLSLGSVCSITTLRRAPPTVPHREERRRR